jgi:MFS family permease
MFGSQVSAIALPFVAVVTLKASAFEVAALGVAEFLPFVLFTLPAGVWVDRLRRRPLMVAADWGRAIALASVPAAYALGIESLPQLYVVGFVTGALTVLFDVSYQSYLPSVVERMQLVEGNAKLEVSRAGSQTAGPALAGLLVSALTAPYAIAADAASFVASAALLTSIRRREALPDPPAEAPRMRDEIRTGLRYVFRHPLLRPLIWQIGLGNFFLSVLSSILIVYAVRVLHMTAASVGVVFSIGNLGLLAGAPIAGALARRIGIGPLLIWGGTCTGCAYVLFAASPRAAAPELLAVAQFVWSFGAVMYFVNGITLIQTITPERLLGRVNASRRFAVWGVIPLGNLCGGAIASGVGLRAAIWVGAIGATVSVYPLLVSPLRSVRVTEDAHRLVEHLNAEAIG